MKRYSIEGTVLSPVHIGSGQELNPFDYIIRDGTMIMFRLEAVLAELADGERDELYRYNDAGDIGRLRNFIAERVDVQKHAYYSADVTPAIERQYKAKIEDIQNQLLITPAIRNGNSFKPYIPGSSLKGALRTAVVSDLAQTTQDLRPYDKYLDREMELKVLKYGESQRNRPGLRPNMGKDPFRAIKIRDIALDHKDVTVAFVRNMSKNRQGRLQANQIQMINEVIKSRVMGDSVTFTGELIFDNDLAGTPGALSRNDITPDFIVRACNAFYMPKIDEEHEKFYENSLVQQASDILLKEAARLSHDECMVRLGRFSGCESVTVDKYRAPEFGRRRNVGGKSRNVCEERYPMGWLKLKICRQENTV